jgi:hypothetical protein
MMHRPLTKLTLVAVCGSLALLAGCAAGAGGAKTASTGASRDPRQAPTRAWTITLSPAPDDLALAEIAFHGATPGARATSTSLRIAVRGPFGDDYLASAAVRLPGGPRALVLLVNRPSPLLDPVDVVLHVTALRSLGRPVVSKLDNPFIRPASSPRPRLCELPLPGNALSASQLSSLRSRGWPLTGFAATGAVAQAYDAACSLPFESSFQEQVTHAAAGSSPPVSSPAPPVGKLPGEGCVPKPGYACPGAVESTRSSAGSGA